MSQLNDSSDNQSFISVEDEEINKPSIKVKLNSRLKANQNDVDGIQRNVHELLSDSRSTTSTGSVSLDSNANEEHSLDEDGDPDMNLILSALEKSVNNSGLKKQNKTFSEEKIRDIERTNSILMKKILSHNRRTSQFNSAPKSKKISSSALNRKKQQRQIDHDNLILLRKIQTVKPAVSHAKH